MARRSPPPAPTTLDPGSLVAATGDESLRSVARRLGVDPALLCRPLTFAQADRYCIRLGLHPAEVWGAVWWAAS